MLGRVARLRDELDRAGCDALVALGSLNAAHLAGYDRYLSDLAGAVGVVVAADGRRTLLVGRCEVPAAEADAHADDVEGYGEADLLELDPVPALVAACRRAAGPGRIAAAGPAAMVAALGDVAETFDPVLDRIRRRKDPDEILRVAESYALALHAQSVVQRGAAEGRSELELFGAAHAAAQQAAGRPVGWVATVAAAARSALVSPPFCVPGPEPIAAGAPVLCDIAVRHRGYWGDTTRTYGGDDEVADVRRELVAIGAQVAQAARPGVPGCDLFALARDAIAERLPGAAFPHHGGHGLGIEIGERPQILPTDPTPLEDGMTIALEPGAYFASRFGVRVEDTYRVGPDGARRIDEVGA